MYVRAYVCTYCSYATELGVAVLMLHAEICTYIHVYCGVSGGQWYHIRLVGAYTLSHMQSMLSMF